MWVGLGVGGWAGGVGWEWAATREAGCSPWVGGGGGNEKKIKKNKKKIVIII